MYYVVTGHPRAWLQFGAGAISMLSRQQICRQPRAWALVAPCCPWFGPTLLWGDGGRCRAWTLPESLREADGTGNVSILCPGGWKQKTDVKAKCLQNNLELGSNKGLSFSFFFLRNSK